MLSKADSRKRWRELRDLVNGHDPLGLIEGGAPPDEYECAVGPLMRLLEQRASATAIREFLTAEFREHFGMPISDASAAELTERARSWYAEHWPSS